jgi:F-type H+-transporting ATPase subunit delta
MKTRRQIKREARRLFRLCLVNGLLDERRVHQVVRAVLASQRRHGYPLLANFLRWVKLDRARHTAEVESAAALPTDLQASVVRGLGRLYGPGMNASFSQNPALIGGMRIRVASDVYDGSIRAGLAALEKRFGSAVAN